VVVVLDANGRILQGGAHPRPLRDQFPQKASSTKLAGTLAAERRRTKGSPGIVVAICGAGPVARLYKGSREPKARGRRWDYTNV